MKVGIITYHKTTNYGACLQALATQTVLSTMGVSPVIVDYDPDTIALTYAHFSAKKYIGLIKQPKTLFRIIASDIRYMRINQKLDESFAAFYRRYYQLSKLCYKTYSELRKTPPILDACITGSDQVWNCDITKGFDPAYFLKWGSDKMKRFSYAASLGKESFSKTEWEELFSLLSSLDAVSLREAKGMNEITRSTGKEVHVCPDPTLLLNDRDWCTLFDIEKRNDNYIFVYTLYQNPEIDRVVNALHEKTGLPIVRIGNRPVYLNEQTVNIADPKKYVELIANASYVVTNSFHGTAFSVNFSKTFWCVLGESRNARMLNLLEKIGLEERAKHHFEEIEISPVNYEEAKKKLDQYREVGLDYLKEGLRLDD